MSDALLINPLEFARRGEQLAGETPLEALPRVQSAVLGAEQPLVWRLAGNLDAWQRPVLSLRITGEVRVVCQRCLEAMPWPLALATDVVLFRNEEQLADAEALDPEIEALLLDEAQDVRQLLEDEILLAIPFAPLHDSCSPKGVKAEPEASAPNPFAVLAALKKRG